MTQPLHTDISDQDLLRRYTADGDSYWVGVLFDRYALQLLGVCMKYLKNEEDARDAVQQIFLKVLSDIHKHEVVYFHAWIYQVSKNYCLMQLRHPERRHPAELTEQYSEQAAAPLESTLNPVEREAALEHMEAALQQLNEPQRICITRFYLEKQSYQEIADSTDYSLLQVKSHIQNGKRNLRLFMEKQGAFKS
ncbi:RNA polymerase sigma-70 factor, ECF subfamily [Chitinophaga costaii]|uniref:RNA polymerase sigma-70 factor, ECF subfamily n=1 Tax=Chitinophaga costaii TaxID=1335309 RepID=A0A1C4CCL9_9BACT|nr:sigma-70 family RNA polymerase sigma factor [Chitinophaga costaii]PUZ27145.1 sigma-70 family RNA polymerase sigma factor [Chitinophaga costaii]SCC16788.1 RNA polymerase sigma-70 factor, ECF subfamily [Chitinophaga costaii]